MESTRSNRPPADLAADATCTHVAGGERTASTLALADAGTLATWNVAGEASGAAPAPGAAAYRLVRVIGRGGMGEVWEAVQVALGRVVAIKRVRNDDGADSAERGRREDEFAREAVVAGRLEHPNIVPVHDFGRDADGTALLAMKLVEGRPWNEILRADFDRLVPGEFLGKHVPILVAMAQAVAFAHSRGVVHRDLKPAQVMVGEFGEVLLTDWGLAIVFGEPDPGAKARSPVILPTTESASSPSGTPALMAPEQTAETASGIGTWTDIYLIGGTLYFLLCGTFPHSAPHASESFMRAAEGIVEPPSKRAPGREVPAELEAIAMDCLAADPKQRPASAALVIDRLRDFLTGANRRRESDALADSARSRLEQSPPRTYQELEETWSTLARAGELWPSNPALVPLRVDTLERYARAALALQDLRLAQAQSERLPAGPLREKLIANVASEDARIARDRRTRRIAVTSTIVLLLGIVAGGTYFTLRLNAERDRAVKERDIATRARTRSDDLLKYMLTDLRTKLTELQRVDPLIRVDFLQDVAIRAFDTYQAQYEDSKSEKEAAAMLVGLGNVYDLLARTGNLEMAMKAVQAAIVLCDNEAPKGKTREWRAARADWKQREAVMLQNQGNLPAAAASMKESIAGMEELARLQPDRADAWKSLITALSGHANILLISGDPAAALAGLERAKVAFATLEKLAPGDADAAGRHANTLGLTAAILRQQGKLEESLAGLMEWRALLQKTRDAHPDAKYIRESMLMHGGRVGEVLAELGRLKEAVASFEEGNRELEEFIEEFPTEVRFRKELASGLTNMANARMALGESTAVVPLYERARDLMLDLCAREPNNAEWRIALATACYQTGLAKWGVQDVPGALDGYLGAYECMRTLAEGKPPDPRWFQSWLIIRVAVAKAYVDLGAPDEASEFLEPLLKEGEAAARMPFGPNAIYTGLMMHIYWDMARVAALRHDEEGAYRLLQKSLDAGYEPEAIRQTVQFFWLGWQNDTRFREFIEEGCRNAKK